MTFTNSKPTYVSPTWINWEAHDGVYMHYEHVDAQLLVAAGILASDDVPGQEFKAYIDRRDREVFVRRCKDGTVNASFYADYLLGRDARFKRFLGDLMSDTRFSLVPAPERRSRKC